jgi:hypothetical protein
VPPADHRLPYGDDPSQFAELRLPSGAGPHPVVVLVHGGCWKAEYATLRDLAPMGDALKAEGIASWMLNTGASGSRAADGRARTRISGAPLTISVRWRPSTGST